MKVPPSTAKIKYRISTFAMLRNSAIVRSGQVTSTRIDQGMDKDIKLAPVRLGFYSTVLAPAPNFEGYEHAFTKALDINK